MPVEVALNVAQAICNKMQVPCTQRVFNIQGAYKLSEDFAKPYFHKYQT